MVACGPGTWAATHRATGENERATQGAGAFDAVGYDNGGGGHNKLETVLNSFVAFKKQDVLRAGSHINSQDSQSFAHCCTSNQTRYLYNKTQADRPLS